MNRLALLWNLIVQRAINFEPFGDVHFLVLIRLNPEDYENLFADECIYTEVRTFEDKVFDVSLTYDVSGDEIYYEKIPELSKKVLATLKPNIGETFFGDFDT